MYSLMMLILIELPVAVISWFGGMIFMRHQYLPILRWQRRQMEKIRRTIKAPREWELPQGTEDINP